MSDYDRSEHWEIVNGPNTNTRVREILAMRGNLAVNWIASNGDLLTILFVLNPIRDGGAGGPIDYNPDPKLWVGLAGFGLFAFRISADPIHPAYLAEKLGILPSQNAVDLAELVNGVMTELVRPPR